MSQSNTVMAFRKRLRSWGYTGISIYKKEDEKGRVIPGVYEVRAIEPLGGTLIVADYSVERMRFSFR